MKAPEQHNLSDIIRLTPEELSLVGEWVTANVMLKRVDHGVSTNHDHPSRRESYLRKTPILNIAPKPSPEAAGTAIGVLLDLCFRAPEDVEDVVSRVHAALLEPTAEYFEMSLDLVKDDHAAVGHVYLPGDGPGESHHDFGPTVPWCIACPEGYGALWIGRNPEAKGIDAIRADAWRIQPLPNSYVLFKGTECPHVVDGLPEIADGVRIGVNFSFRPMGQLAMSAAGAQHPRRLAMLSAED